MSSNMFPITAAQAPKQIERILKVGLVPILLSAPGVGKSSVCHQIAKQRDLQLIDVRLSQVDAPEMNGYPDLQGDVARYVAFDIFPTVDTPLPPGKKGWLLFLDELTSAPRHVVAAAYNLILDRMVGQKALHPKCFIVTAGNRKEDRAIVNEMGSAMQSRIVHLELQTDLKAWMDWAVPAGIDHRVIGFLQFQPPHLNQFKPENVGSTFACERTWEFVSKISDKLSDQELEEYIPSIAGAVGSGPATDYMNFVRIFKNLPSIASILADPLNADLPGDPGTRFAMAVNIASKLDKTNVDKLAVYLARLQPEAQVVAVRLARGRDPELMKTPAMGKIFIAITQYL